MVNEDSDDDEFLEEIEKNEDSEKVISDDFYEVSLSERTTL